MIPEIRRLDRSPLVKLPRLILLTPSADVEAVQEDPLPVDLVVGRIVLALLLELHVFLDVGFTQL